MNPEVQRVKELRDAGLTFQQIGNLLGFSRQYAHQLASGYHPMNVRAGLRRTLNLIIKTRDDNHCQFCGSLDSLILHHIDRNTKNNKSYNLTTMCQSCHRYLHLRLDKS